MMTIPLAGAAPLSVTVPVEEDPPKTEVGDSERLTSVTGFRVRVAVSEVPFKVAVIVALVVVATPVVVMVKVAVVAPAATVTVDGGTALVTLEPNETTVPPVGAAPLSVTVPVEEVPPWTDVGATVTLVRAAGLMVSVAFCETPPCVPVMVAKTALPTAEVLMTKVAEVAPAGTVTLPCTVALVLLQVRDTPTPPTAAGPDKVTVPVDLLPPVTELGDTVRLNRAGVAIVNVAVWVWLLSTAEMVAVFVLWSGVVLIVNVPVEAPLATVTELGTDA